jgi:2'-5' RNA ligase
VRLFVAVWPSEPVAARLADLPRPVRPGLRWTVAAQWHVTLRFLGAVPDVEPAKQALLGVDQDEATAVAGPRLAVLGRGVLSVPVAGLDDLAAAVLAATGSIGRPEPDRPFRGHLTLARAKPGVDLHALSDTPFAARWAVREVTLVASDTRADGARYEVMSRRALR